MTVTALAYDRNTGHAPYKGCLHTENVQASGPLCIIEGQNDEVDGDTKVAEA